MTSPLTDYPDWHRPLDQGILQRLALVSEGVAAGGFITSGEIDVRNFASVAVTALATVPGVATAYNRVETHLSWTAEFGGFMMNYRDAYAFWAKDAGGGGFVTPGGHLNIHEPVRGGGLTVQVRNQGTNNLDLTLEIHGTSRQLSERSIREFHAINWPLGGEDETIADSQGVFNLAAGATRSYLTRLHVGRAWVRMSAGTTQHTFAFIDCFGFQIDAHTLAAATIVRLEQVYPARALRINVTNDGAVAGDHRLNVYGERYRR